MTDSSALDARLREARNLFFDHKGRRFVHQELGFNYRMTALQASLGLAQLKHIDEAIRRKREIGHLYLKLFHENFSRSPELKDKIRLPSVKNDAGEANIFWVFMVEILDEKTSAQALMQLLGKRSVGTRPCFYPMHLQPVFVSNENSRYYKKVLKISEDEIFSESERLAEKAFYLPSGLALTNEDVELVVDRALDAFKEAFLLE